LLQGWDETVSSDAGFFAIFTRCWDEKISAAVFPEIKSIRNCSVPESTPRSSMEQTHIIVMIRTGLANPMKQVAPCHAFFPSAKTPITQMMRAMEQINIMIANIVKSPFSSY
jgi:hypothetical protein